MDATEIIDARASADPFEQYDNLALDEDGGVSLSCFWAGNATASEGTGGSGADGSGPGSRNRTEWQQTWALLHSCKKWLVVFLRQGKMYPQQRILWNVVERGLDLERPYSDDSLGDGSELEAYIPGSLSVLARRMKKRRENV